MKCSNHFGTKRRMLLKVNIVLVPKGAIQNFIKNIRYDIGFENFTFLCQLSIKTGSNNDSI